MAAEKPSRLRRFAKRSVPCLVRTKIRQRPVSLESKPFKTCCLRSPETSNACMRTFSEGFDMEPSATRTGEVMYLLVNCATESGSVAEKHMVWRFTGNTPTMRRMEGRKPMSSIRSASSRTRIEVPRKSTSLRSRKSSKRPGVATIKRAPLRIAASCCRSGNPPTTWAAGASLLPRNASYCAATCIASSRVGTKTKAVIAGICDLSKCSNTGIRNASVLPVPVWAVAKTSLP